MRLLLLGLPVPDADARRALRPLDPEALQEAHLLHIDNGVVVYTALAAERGWPAERYQEWLAGAMQASLLA